MHNFRTHPPTIQSQAASLFSSPSESRGLVTELNRHQAYLELIFGNRKWPRGEGVPRLRMNEKRVVPTRRKATMDAMPPILQDEQLETVRLPSKFAWDCQKACSIIDFKLL